MNRDGPGKEKEGLEDGQDRRRYGNPRGWAVHSFIHSSSIYYAPTLCRDSGEWEGIVFDLVELRVKRSSPTGKQEILPWCDKCC